MLPFVRCRTGTVPERAVSAAYDNGVGPARRALITAVAVFQQSSLNYDRSICHPTIRGLHRILPIMHEMFSVCASLRLWFHGVDACDPIISGR